MNGQPRILLVEDDTNLGFIIQDNLKLSKFQVNLYKDGESALRSFVNTHYDLCILDIMLPKKDGISLAQDIRKLNSQIPIIFLTAKSMTEDKIRGFKSGGDDYITKPFEYEELKLRIEAILKRTLSKTSDANGLGKSKFDLLAYQFDAEAQMLYFQNKEEKKLTKKESELLKLLCQHQNKILTRELTLRTIWGNDDYFSGRSMDVFISKLRKYLGKEEGIQILNVHGVGFKMIIDKDSE